MKKYILYIMCCLICVFVCGCRQEMSIDIENTETVIFQPGDVFSKTFLQTKLTPQQSLEILQELKNLTNINKCKPNDFYEITYSSAIPETWAKFTYFPEGQYYYCLVKSTDNIITSEKIQLQTKKEVFEISGVLDTSLWESMTALNIKPEVILAYADIFAWQIDFLTDPRKGDIFKLIYEIETLEKKQTIVSTTIIAGQYITASSSFTAVMFTNADGTQGYFDETGKSVRSAFLKAPLQFKRISSFFTKKRYHPILKYYRAHEGIDYAAPIGTPVSAVGDGVVKKSQYSGGYGNLVILRHSNGYESYYGHLSKYGRGIKKGARVKQGQIIGYVGSTGLSTGPHLDFRMKKNGTFINFLKMKMPPVTTLQGQDKDNFKSNADNIMQKFQKI